MGNRLGSRRGQALLPGSTVGAPCVDGQTQVPLLGAGPAVRILVIEGSDCTDEICETATEGAVMLDGSAQFLGVRVFAMPGG